MSGEIKIVATDFDSAIQQIDNKRLAYEAAANPLITQLGYASHDVYWENMQRETFEYGAAKMGSIQNQCSRNLYFLSNLLRQVQLDFEAIDNAP